MRSSSAKRHHPLLILCLALTVAPVAANEAIEGEWMLELRGKGPTIIGLLTLEHDADTWRGHVEGGPIEVDVNGEALRLVIDSRDLQGFVFNRVLEGEYRQGRLSGRFSIDGSSYAEEAGGVWTGTRATPPRPRQAPQPVDLSGTWKPSPGIDFRKYSMDLTDRAQAWFDGYSMRYDQPNVRCVSTGIPALIAWGGYPMEILATPKRLTMIFEVESEVRRLFLDGREPPEHYPTSPMGWSNAYWDGSDLIVETQAIESNVRDFRGEPVSDGARMHERYTLSEDGQTLSAVITLLDSANYRVPPIRRRQWQRSPDTVIYPYECDPDAFYRQMHDEGQLEHYFERAARRNLK